MPPHALLPALHVRRVQLRVAQPRPRTLDAQALGADAHAQAAVHVRRDLQPRAGPALEAATTARLLRRGQRQLREALRDGFQLQQGGQQDVHVRVAAPRLVNPVDLRGGEDAHGDVLRDGRLALRAAAAGAEVVRVLVCGVLAVVVVVVGVARCGGERAAFKGGAAGGAGDVGGGEDGEREERLGVFLCEADGGGCGGLGGAEGAVQGGEGHFEVDGVVGGGGLDGVVVENGFLENGRELGAGGGVG